MLLQGNAIYNILPDVISRLSDPDLGIAEDNFQEIMRYVVVVIIVITIGCCLLQKVDIPGPSTLCYGSIKPTF